MSLIASMLFAVLTTVKLPVAGGAQETYFLPFDEAAVDTSTLVLKTADGKDVPYSLDDRLGFPQDGKYRPPADGYHSTESAPAKERCFRRLGWLSFRVPDGTSELELSFETAPGKAVARPNPSVRTWWVSLVDPAVMAKRPSEVAGGWILPAKALPAPERLAGRRFLVSLITSATREKAPDYSNFAVRLPNESRGNANLVQLGFRSGVEPVESVADAIVAPDAKAFVNEKRPIEFSSCYAADQSQRSERPLRIDDLLMQSPPQFRPSVRLHPPCDLYNVGESVRVSRPDLSGEYLADFASPALSGLRVMADAKPADVKMALLLADAKGRTVAKARGETLSLEGVKPGHYVLTSALRVGTVDIARTKWPLEVQPAPDWAK